MRVLRPLSTLIALPALIAIAHCERAPDKSEANTQGAPYGADGGGGLVTTVVEGPGATDTGTPDRCAAFAPLKGITFTANVGENEEWFWANIPEQPVRTKIGIIAAGPPSEIKGQLVTLGVAANADFATCTHCLLLAVGCTADDCSDAKWFFPTSGSGSFTQLAATDQTFAGAFKDVVFDEVAIDAENRTTRVEGGACVRLPSLVFRATPLSDDGGTPSAADADADPDGSGSSGSGGGSNGGGGKQRDGGTVINSQDAAA